MDKKAGTPIGDDVRRLVPTVFCAVTFALSVDELVHCLYPHRPLPLLFAVLFALGLACAFFLFRRAAKGGGFEGPRYIAQILERELSLFYRVYNDIQLESGGRRFNIDHLVVGRNGVFCIETKTWSKPERGETVASYDGKVIALNGVVRQPNAVAQAEALAEEAQRFVYGKTGVAVPVLPVIACVGWFVRKTIPAIPKVWVANENALPTFIRNGKAEIKEEDFNLITDRLDAIVSGK